MSVYNLDDGNALSSIMLHLSKWVKRDDDTKKTVLLAALSAYLHNEESGPCNVFLRGPPSIGKSFVVKQVLTRYFPRGDYHLIKHLTPRALSYLPSYLEDEYGEIIPEPTEDMSDEEILEIKRRLKKAVKVVMLDNKILALLEEPEKQTLDKLKPILSHDAYETEEFTVDKAVGERSMMKGVRIKVKGWPCAIFCSTESKTLEEMSSRGVTLTPEMLPEKYKEGIASIFYYASRVKVSTDPIQDIIRQHILSVRDYASTIVDVLPPFADLIAPHWPYSMGRFARDADHFLKLIKSCTLLEYKARPRIRAGKDWYLISAIPDFKTVAQTFVKIEETTVTGVSRHLLDFYHSILEPYKGKESLSYAYLVNIYRQVYGKPISKETIRSKYIKPLQDIGFVDIEPDPTDSRKNVVEVVDTTQDKLIKYTEAVESFNIDDFRKWLIDNVNRIGEIKLYGPDNNEVDEVTFFKMIVGGKNHD